MRRSSIALGHFLNIAASCFLGFSEARAGIVYTNALTNSASVAADFMSVGSDLSYGAFEVNPASGLEAVSAGTNSRITAKVLNTPLSCSSNWQVTVLANMQKFSNEQVSPFYYVGVSIVDARSINAGNRVNLLLQRFPANSGTNNTGAGMVNVVGGGIYTNDVPLPQSFGGVSGAEQVWLRCFYESNRKLLHLSYSTDRTNFVFFDTCDIEKLWGVSSTNLCYLALSAGIFPEQPVDTVSSGQMSLRNLSIDEVSMPQSGVSVWLETSTNNLSNWSKVPLTADSVTSSGEIGIGSPSSGTNVFYRLRIRLPR